MNTEFWDARALREVLAYAAENEGPWRRFGIGSIPAPEDAAPMIAALRVAVEAEACIKKLELKVDSLEDDLDAVQDEALGLRCKLKDTEKVLAEVRAAKVSPA